MRKPNAASMKPLASGYGIKMLVLFGSHAKGEQHRASDVDIAYLGSGELSLKDESRLARDLAKAFGGKRVDIVSLGKAPPLLAYQVARYGRLLYASDRSLFSRFKIYAIKLYHEARPLFQLREERVRQRIRHAGV